MSTGNDIGNGTKLDVNKMFNNKNMNILPHIHSINY